MEKERQRHRISAAAEERTQAQMIHELKGRLRQVEAENAAMRSTVTESPY